MIFLKASSSATTGLDDKRSKKKRRFVEELVFIEARTRKKSNIKMSNHLNTTTSIFFTSLDENGTGYSTTYVNEASSAMVDTEPLRVFGLVIGIFAIIVGSIGNLLTIAAIKTNKKLHKPFYIFIGNLSVIDFLTATSMLPFNVASYYQRVSICLLCFIRLCCYLCLLYL